MVVLKIFPSLTKPPQTQVLSCPNLAWYFPRRTCEQNRILWKVIKTIILKKSKRRGIRVRKLSVFTKRLQIITSFAVYVQRNLNIIEDQHIQFHCALDCRTKSFWSFHEVGKGDMRVPKPHRTFVYVCVLLYHSTATEFAQASTEDVENTKCSTFVQRDNSTVEPHSGRHTVSSLPEASVLAHAATFPGACALLLDPRTKNWNAYVKENQAIRLWHCTSHGYQRKLHWAWLNPASDVTMGNWELDKGSLSRQYSQLQWHLGLPISSHMIKELFGLQSKSWETSTEGGKKVLKKALSITEQSHLQGLKFKEHIYFASP